MNLLKHVKDRYDTMQEPGHSGLSSGGDSVVVVGLLVVVTGFGLDVIDALVLSQQTWPLWQLEVLGTNTYDKHLISIVISWIRFFFFCVLTDGFSQKAAIKFSRQIPGHFGYGEGVGCVGAGLLVVGGGGAEVVYEDPDVDGCVMQQLPSSGQPASSSMSSQNNAKRPLTHSPLHGLAGCFDVGFCSGLDWGLRTIWRKFVIARRPEK